MLRIIIVSLLILPCLGRIAEELKEEPPAPAPPPPPAPTAPPPSPAPATCFQASRELCPNGTLGCTKLDSISLLCCDVDSFTLREGLAAELNQSIVNLHIINATLDHLNVSQSTWRRLSSMSVTDGNIKSIVGRFNVHSSLSCLNISNNGLQEMNYRALVSTINLTTLDMSHNDLRTMPHFNGRRDLAIDIRGNNNMLCRSVLDILERIDWHLNFININATFCTSSKTFHWFNTTELISIRQVEVIHELKNDCPEVSSRGVKCTCDMVRVDIVQGKPPTFSVGVDCSNRQLKELPLKLPPNTVKLNVTNNNISSLVIDHSSYDQLRELYADNNNIQSIVDLEGSKFIDNFMMLSLKNNKLKAIPTYIISNALDRNYYSRTIYLANNYLHCDCNTAKVLKVWMFDKSNIIPDYEQIYCEKTKGKAIDKTKGRVIDLIESKMCQQQRDWTDYISYIIALELILLLGLVTKVSYDYWVFKSAGYLPWPASKMPKLPCDWLCE